MFVNEYIFKQDFILMPLLPLFIYPNTCRLCQYGYVCCLLTWFCSFISLNWGWGRVQFLEKVCECKAHRYSVCVNIFWNWRVIYYLHDLFDHIFDHQILNSIETYCYVYRGQGESAGPYRDHRVTERGHWWRDEGSRYSPGTVDVNYSLSPPKTVCALWRATSYKWWPCCAEQSGSKGVNLGKHSPVLRCECRA